MPTSSASRPEKIILGIDPGYADTGYGIVKASGSSFVYLLCGTISSPKTQPFAERLLNLSEKLEKLIEEYRPQLMAIEQLFFFKNQKTAMNVAQARGVALLTASRHGLAIAEFTPPQVKQSLTSYGQATKPQVGTMVRRLLAPAQLPKQDDAIDALAIALCAHFRSHIPR